MISNKKTFISGILLLFILISSSAYKNFAIISYKEKRINSSQIFEIEQKENRREKREEKPVEEFNLKESIENFDFQKLPDENPPLISSDTHMKRIEFDFLTDTGEDSELVHRLKRPKVDTLFSSLFFSTRPSDEYDSASSRKSSGPLLDVSFRRTFSPVPV